MHRKRFVLTPIFILLLIAVSSTTLADITAAASKPTFTISPNSKPYKGNMTNYSTYNKFTKDYYLIRSYLEQLETTGGGTLVLKKGTYTITNVLYVPSNVTILLENGSIIRKGTKTGTAKFDASKSIFQLIKPSNSKKTGVYGKHNGEKNIQIIGKGKAVIDLDYFSDSLAIVAGHNTNLTIENIQFKHMHSGHFIEIDATKHATIRNNTFKHSKASKQHNKEAINIDTPDKTTNGFGSEWSKMDKTPNVHMLIENNRFINLDRAIGTHKYSGGKYHDHIVIRNNLIDKTRLDAIRVMNWTNAVIEDNTIKNVAPGPKKNTSGIKASGAVNPVFQNNVIVSTPRPLQFVPWKNTNAGSQYDVTYNELSDKNIEALKTNTVIDHEEDAIRIYKKYQDYGKNNTDYIHVQTAAFYDLLEGDSGYHAAMELIDKGIIQGYQDFSFKPFKSISREHVALMLTRTKDLHLNKPENVTANLKNYADVDRDYVYADAIATVSAAGIFSGSNGKFNPNATITRGQMASVLVKAFELEDNGQNVPLSDLDSIDPAHRENVKILAQHQITLGKLDEHGKYYFDANGKLTRVQFTQLLQRTLELQ